MNGEAVVNVFPFPMGTKNKSKLMLNFSINEEVSVDLEFIVGPIGRNVRCWLYRSIRVIIFTSSIANN